MSSENPHDTLKDVPSIVDYNQEVVKQGFKGDGHKVKIAVISSGNPDHEIINTGKPIIFSNSDYGKDTIGQSTIMGGILIANSENLKGMIPKASVSFLKVSNNDDNVNISSLISAMLWSIIKKVDIISLPISISEDFPDFAETIKKAFANNICVICDSGLVGGTDSYPAKYPETLSVGTLNHSKELFKTSLSGRVNVLGTSMLTTYIGNKYIFASGGACSVAYATGLMALLIAENNFKNTPDELYAELETRLKV